VIEDTELNRKLVKTLLLRDPYNILEAIGALGSGSIHEKVLCHRETGAGCEERA